MKKTLGDRLRELRDTRDLSLRELARQLEGVTAAHLSDIEFGRRFPSDELLAKLARFFKVEEAELRVLDTRPPVEEMKRLAQTDPAFGLALRKLVDKEITPDDILKLTKGKPDRPKQKWALRRNSVGPAF
jgi:transcriptional regulator with XRE-family HTH domain